MLTAFANGTVFGTRIGTGAPRVLALHGWGGTAAQMGGVLEGLDAISIDLPGFGASPAPDVPWGAEAYAAAILPVLDAFNEPPVVVGYSFGGRVAVHLAAEHADRLKSLVLTGVPLLRRSGAAKTSRAFQLVRWAHRRGLVSDQRMEQERQKRGSADYRRASGVMRDILVKAVNETYEPQLAKLTVPVELVWGAADTAAPPWIIDEALAMLPVTTKTNVTVVEGSDHFLPVHSPHHVRQAIMRALA